MLTAGVVPEERALFFISTHVKGVHVGDRRFTDQIKADVAFIVVAEAMGMPESAQNECRSGRAGEIDPEEFADR